MCGPEFGLAELILIPSGWDSWNSNMQKMERGYSWGELVNILWVQLRDLD